LETLMKYSEISEKKLPTRRWMPYLASSVLALAIAGCGGGGTGANSTAANTAAATIDSTAAWKALAPQITITSANIDTKPVVNFTVKDATGKPVTGIGGKSKSATASVASLTNIAFTLAKLVPGTNNQPSKWVSYIVTTAPVYNTATPPVLQPVLGTFPANDKEGALTDNGDGSYTYTFYRDVKQAATQVAALAEFATPALVATAATAFKYQADLGDVTFDPTLTHRVGIQIGGTAPGTGTNYVDPLTLLPIATGAPVGVSMVNAGNAWFDFRPDHNPITSTREVVKLQSCNDCHAGKVLAHGSRVDPNYCVTCHTDQIKYSFNQEASTAAGSNGLILNGTTRPTTAVIDGRAVGNYPNMVHKIHMGTELVKQGYFFNAASEGMFNEVKFPQDQRNCSKCHNESLTPVNHNDAGNWKTVPSPLACGSCHDGIKFTDGTGTTTSGKTTGHGGWALKGVASADPALCSTCHDATSIAFVHTPVTPPDTNNSLLLGGTNANTNAAWIASNTANRPANSIKVTYDIKYVSRVGTHPVMSFRMKQNDVVVPLNIYTPSASPPVTEIWNNFMGSPSVYFVFSVPQDGIATPADFNASASSYLRSLWNGTATGTGAGTLVADTVNTGYYIATLTNVIIPDSAVMLTGGLGYTYNVTSSLPLTQTNLPAYPVVAATGSGLTTGMPNQTGGLIVVAPDVQVVASKGCVATTLAPNANCTSSGGYTGRRAIVEDARCNKCHQELGVFTAESFHGGQRNDGTTCAWCHTPNKTSSGWGADSTNYIHAIHAASKRVDQFTWHATAVPTTAMPKGDGFFSIGFPGVLKKCETCHLPGTYDLAATASAAALPNKQYRTVATGVIDKTSMTPLNAFSVSPYLPVANPSTFNYGAGFSFNVATGATTQAAGTTLVDSPVTTVCFACHDSKAAQAHMKAEGGSIYVDRATALNTPELCMTCHASGRVADIRLMHSK